MRPLVSTTLRIAVLAGVAVVASGARAANDRRAIAETDLFEFHWIADPQISPDGSRIAFVKVGVNRKADRYDTEIWLAPLGANAGKPRQVTAGPRDLAPRWSPDGVQLAFLRALEKDGKPQPSQIHVLSMAGGEAMPVTDLPRGAGPPEWSPDGKRLAFTTTTTDEDLAKKAARKPAEGGDAPRESDVRVITRAAYRSNGAGYLDPKRRSHVWTVALPAAAAAELPRPAQVTAGAFEETSPAWSPDGTRLYFTTTRVVEPYYELSDRDLYSVPAAGGEPTLVASIDGAIGGFAVSPDGRRIAFTGTASKPVRSYNQPDLFVASIPDGAVRNLTATYDFDVAGGIGSDQHAPRGGEPGTPIWSKDGRSILIGAAAHGRANLVRVDAATGNVDPLTRGDHDLVSYSASADASKLALVVSTPTSIGDLFAADGASGALSPAARVNDELFARLELTPPEEFWYTSFDGRKIQAWIQKPPAFDAAKKYPLILEIHGGPHAAYGFTFTHEFQWMAARGYVVLYTNPRGSSSYGQEFGNIIQYRYPGDDYRDLMLGVDALLARGYVDPNRLGVTGGSGGGLLTNWVVTQTDRFAAAASQRSISDWAAFWGTADFTLFQPTWFHKAPWEDPADYAARSPLTHVAKVRTPLLFIEGEIDYRTPPGAGGEAMFRALKYLRKPTAMVRFPDESHELSRSGKPWHRVERLQHIVNWFDKYLLGKPIKIYDVE